MNTLTLQPNSIVTIDNPMLGEDVPIHVAIQTPVLCTVQFEDTLCTDKKNLFTKGREIRLTIQY